MDGTATYTQFMDQPVSQLDPKELLDLAKKNLKIFGEIEQKQFKRLEAQLKYEKNLDKKEKENRDVQTRRQKELDDLKEKNYKEELDRVKEQKENLNKLKSFSVSDIIPSRIQDLDVGKSQEDFYNQNKTFLQKIASTLELIPEKIQKTVRKPQDEKTGEQKNIGEEIMRVSFNKEGIQILKTLLDPIYKALQANTESLDKMLKKIADGNDSGGSGGWLALLAVAVTSLIKYIYIKVMAALRTIEFFKTKFFQLIEWFKKIPDRIRRIWRESRIGKWLQEKWKNILEGIKDLGRYVKAYWDEFIVKPFQENWNKFIERAKKILNFDELKEAFQAKWTKFIDKIKSFFTFDGLMTKFEEAGKGIKWVFGIVKGWFSGLGKVLVSWYEKSKDVLKSIMSMFSKEGIFGKIFELIKTVFGGIGGKVTGFFKFFGKILGPLAILIDPVVTAIKGFYSLWGDESLSPIQKGIAIFTGVIASFADIFGFLIDIISKGVTGIWNWITGKGWNTENPVSKFIEKDVYRGQGGVGAGTTEGMADMMRDYNKRGAGGLLKDIVEGGIYRSTFGLVDVRGKTTDQNKEIQKRQKRLDEINEDGVVSEEERKEMESWKPLPVDDFIMSPKGISSYIFDKKNNQLYETAPQDEIIATKKGGIIDKSLEELKMIMSEVNRGILNLNSNISNIQPAIVNNTTVSNNSGENKSYLFRPLFDVNDDKRVQWWRNSREYSATA